MAQGTQETPLVLVVDDDPPMRQAIRWALEDEGLEVETAADGQQAVDLARQRRPSLVVLDIRLPVLDGFTVADELRAVHGPGLPILAISADGRITVKARRLGAYAHLAKPFELDELVLAVRRGLGER
jgi:DNA-binding response OmpR family regulator